MPKLVRALGTRTAEPPDFVIHDRLSASQPAAYAIQAAIGRGVRRIILNDAGTRLGDVEALHQMRVGARRLRSDLRAFAPLLERSAVDHLRSELRWLGGALGDVRDVDVIRDRLRRHATDLNGDLEPLFLMVRERHAVARASLLSILRSTRYVELLEALVSANQSPPLSALAWEPSREVLPRLVATIWDRLARDARSVDESDPGADYHRVRIKAKRLRYAAEAVAPALGGKRGKGARELARRAARIQDVLGEMQDAVTAQGIVRDTVREHPEDGPLNFAAGRLVERESKHARAAGTDFTRAWQKLDRKGLWRWLTR
jgi:CHAD domain-containing protein